MNRIRNYLDPPDEECRYGDFVVVSGSFGSVCVTHDTARDIVRLLDRRPAPKWVAFRDRVGSRIRLRTREIRAFAESTAAQRASDRRLERARRAEEESDRRSWEED
jgi:hypothetical protein